MKPILWLSSKAPLPLNDGGRLATHALVHELGKLGIVVDLLCVAQASEAFDSPQVKVAYNTRNAWCFRRQGTFRTISFWEKLNYLLRDPFRPLTFYGFADSKYPQLIDALSSGTTCEIEGLVKPSARDWGLVVYDGLHPAAHSISGGAFLKPSWNIPAVYRAHNLECELWESASKATRNIIAKFFLNQQSKFIELFEFSFCLQISAIAAISEALKKKLMPSNKNIVVIPFGVDFSNPLAFPNSENLQLGFIGRLDWPPNKEGLIWFLDRIWPKLLELRAEVELRIAGSGDADFLKKYLDLKNIQFMGEVAESSQVYRQSQLMLCPLFSGSGVRIKAVEAASFGRALISTKLGTEGLDLQHNAQVLHAETEEDWLKLLSTLKLDQTRLMGENAFNRLKVSNSAESAARQFLALYQALA